MALSLLQTSKDRLNILGSVLLNPTVFLIVISLVPLKFMESLHFRPQNLPQSGINLVDYLSTHWLPCGTTLTHSLCLSFPETPSAHSHSLTLTVTYLSLTLSSPSPATHRHTHPYNHLATRPPSPLEPLLSSPSMRSFETPREHPNLFGELVPFEQESGHLRPPFNVFKVRNPFPSTLPSFWHLDRKLGW